MPAYGYRPAAGASGGPAPLPTDFHAPEFLRLDRAELVTLLQRIRDPLAVHVYLLVLGYGVFETGEFLGSYARLQELCRPPQPPRGQWRRGPSMKALRNAVTRLVDAHLLVRGSTNEAQGQLRLRAYPRKTKKTK